MQEFVSNFGASLAALAAGLAGTAIGFKRAQKLFLKESAEANKAAAEDQVVSMLRTELTRMSSQNTLLATELNRLQLEMAHLGAQVAQLTAENTILNDTIGRLTSEIQAMQPRPAQEGP